MTRMPTAEEIEALKKALAEALGELRVLRTERDLLKEQLNRFKRQLFEAKSEASAAHQKDMFFNEAEVEGAQAQPAAAQTEDEKIDVPAHQRAKRGRKPLDPALPRGEVVVELLDLDRAHGRILPNQGNSGPSGVTRRVQAYRGEVTDSGMTQPASTRAEPG